MSVQEWSEEKFRALTMHSADIISLLDRDGRLLFNSEATLRINGFTPDELRGRDTTELIHPEDRAGVQQAFAALLAGPGTTVRAQYRYLTKDGRWLWMEAVATNQLDNPAVGGIVAISRDIGERLRVEAERKRVEQQLQQRQKLASLGLLAGSVAHDFNNLLSVILGEAMLLRGSDGAEAAQSIDAIESAARQAARLTHRLLSLAGGSRGGVESIDPAALVRDVAPLLALAVRPGVRLALEVEDGLPSMACDAGQLRQALLNLVQNASEAMRRDGTVTVRAYRHALDAARLTACRLAGGLHAGEVVALEVRDEGDGMSPETADRVFDPFFSTKQAGRGLGLAAVSNLVHAHDAALALQSVPGVGTTFTIYFQPSADPIVEAPRPAQRRFGGAALVVDDDEAVARTTARQLAALGFEPEVELSGEAAVARVEGNPGRWGLVVCDLRMPGLDGAATTRRIRERVPTLPVLQVSGYPPEGVEVPIGPGVGFLSKPFEQRQLAEAVAGLVPEAVE